jgi:ABC-type multidrug transport system fused ATPase/permease subunit
MILNSTELSTISHDTEPLETDTPKGLKLESYIPALTVPSNPITTGRIITDFGKVLFSKENRWPLMQATFLTICNTGNHFATPLLFGKVVQTISSRAGVAVIAGIGISQSCLLTLLVASYALSQILPTVRAKVCIDVQTKVTKQLLQRGMDHLLHQSLDYYVRTPFGEMFTLLQKSFTIQNFGVPMLTQIIPTLLEIGIAATLMARQYDAIVAGSLLLLTTSYVLYSALTTRPILESREEAIKTGNATFNTIGKNLSQYKIMRDCNQFDPTMKEINDALDEMRKADAQAYEMPIQVNLGHSVLSYAHMLFVTLYIGRNLQAPKSQDFITLLGYLGSLASLLPSFGHSVNDVLSSYPDLKFVFSKLSQPHQVVDPYPDVPLLIEKAPSIEFENVSFQYSTQTETLFKSLSFKISPGQKVALVSKSGAGKTSLFNMLYGYYNPDQGLIKINDQDIAKVSLNSLQTQICLLGQNPNLFLGTLRENIVYGAPDRSKVTDEALYALAKSVGFDDFFDSLPDKLDTDVGEGGKALSGGQQQKVSLLRSLLKTTKIRLLDEVTASLDGLAATNMLQSLLSEDVTTLMITHKLTEAKMADEILFLEEGQIVKRGTHEELLQTCAPYLELWNAQQQP